jgi:hypothetical protein
MTNFLFSVVEHLLPFIYIYYMLLQTHMQLNKGSLLYNVKLIYFILVTLTSGRDTFYTWINVLYNLEHMVNFEIFYFHTDH